ncbi:uncharacterized protein LOC108676115 isoform X3 [Hyalella azteca]|uniref:Uncharacterized protein LOC108676115 isoform X3 n=1 Tax=Hyalella azteca TaxID=294128 RepID=A0A979FM53_HYAAZ|nr:uncharacterized protein LOC108676115 isoform X3 [Hyalella azteca]
MENEERYFQPVQVENPNSVLLQAHESFSITNRDERIMPIGESDNLFSDSISVRRNSNSIYGETSVAANSINSQHKNHSNSYFNKDIHSKESVTNISILPTQDIAKLKPELERHLQKPIPRSTQNRGISQLLTRPGTSTIQLTQASRGQRTHCIDRGYAEGRGGNESFQVTRQNSTGNVSIRSQVPGNVLFAREQDVLNDSYTRAQLGSSTELRHVAHTTEFSQRQESEKVFNIEEHDVRGNVLQFREHCRTNNNFSQNSDSIHSPLLQKQYQRIISIPDGEGEESIFSTIKNLPNDARYLPRQILGDGSMIRDLMSNEIDLVQRDVDGNFRIIRRQLPQNVGTIQRQFPRNVEIIQSQVPRNVQLVNRQEDLDDVVVQNRSHMPVHASENRTEASTQQRLLPGYLKFVQRTTPGKMYIVHGRGEPPVLRRLEYHEVPSIPRELLDSSSREGLRRDDSLTMQAFNVFSQISNKNAEIYASNYTTGIELTQQDARNRRDTLETLENNLGQETRSSTSILERALLEPERRHSRESLLPTQIDNISFNECNQLTKMDKHASRSQSPEHSEGGDDWVDEDVVQESKASLKRVQHCAFCRNHNLTIRKYGHVCKFKNCTCLLCKLVVHSQTIMKHQQAHWRLQNKELVNNESYKEMKASKREKLCDKCRNHSEFKERRGHSCPFDTCTCKHCGLTSKRRKVSKYLQRIRRANVTSESYGGSKSCSAPPPINEAGSKLELVPTSQSRIFAQRTKQKRMQSCTFCQNHGFTMPKPGHQCPYNKCQCLLCRLTRIARIVMKHQQALWRHQAKELNKANLGHLAKLRQVCDKCRNHHQFPKRRGHSICPFEQCTCPYCTLTEKRRYVMMRIQRIRRGQITATAIFQSDKEDEMETADTDQGRGSSKGNSDFPAEGREVAAVIEGVTKALRALPSPVRKLSSQTAADHETLDESQEASGESEEALGELQEELNDLDESLDEIEEKLKALDATPAETLMDAIEAEPRNASSEFD